MCSHHVSVKAATFLKKATNARSSLTVFEKSPVQRTGPNAPHDSLTHADDDLMGPLLSTA